MDTEEVVLRLKSAYQIALAQLALQGISTMFRNGECLPAVAHTGSEVVGNFTATHLDRKFLNFIRL